MWRGFGRHMYRDWRRSMRWRNRGFWGPMGGWGYNYGPRRGPCCCLFFALPVFLLPFAVIAMLAMHIL